MQDEESKRIQEQNNLGMNHEFFVERLTKSQEAVIFLKEYIQSKGLDVFVPELRIAPDIASRGDYSDEIDLIFYRKNGCEVRVEVKQLSKTFALDWEYDTLIVNSITGYRSKQIKPDIHILLSKDRKYAAIIEKDTFDKWFLKKMFDKVKKKELWFYLVKKEYVKFVKL